MQKDNTEMRLKNDVQASQIDGHKSEIQHLKLELRETGDLYKIYEEKCESLITQLTDVNAELNNNKRIMIGFNQNSEEKDDKITALSKELDETKVKNEEMSLQLGTL